VRFVAFIIVLSTTGSQPSYASEWTSGIIHPDTPFPEAAPDVAVGTDGVPFVVWDYGEIWWTRWDKDSGRWSTPGLVNEPNAVADEYPRISIGEDNVPWVIWSQYQATAGTWAQVCSRYVEGSWTTQETVLTPTGGNDLFDIVALNEIDAWVASQGTGPDGQDIFVGHYEDGTWVNRGWLSAGPDLDMDPSVVIDSNGRAWVAWVYVGGPWTVVVSRLEDGQWTAPDAMPIGRVLPELASIGTTIFLVWRADDSGHGSNVLYRVWDGDWSDVGFVNAPDSVNTTDTSPSISTSGKLGPIVAWTAGESGSQQSWDIRYATWTGSGWSPEHTVPDSLEMELDQVPEVALDPSGVGWIAWERWGPWPQNPDFDIWYGSGPILQTTGISPSPIPPGPVSILHLVPNPSRGFSSAVFVVREAGRFEAVVSDVTGRVIDRISLGWLSPGLYAGDRAFRWPLGRDLNPKSGVYFLALQDTSKRRPAATGKFTLLRGN
jgi:hypothetical protein